MAIFEQRPPAAGVSCTAGSRTYVAGIAAPTGEPINAKYLGLSTRSQSIQDLPMLVELLEFTVDGTGSTLNTVALDGDVTRTAPAGKHTYTVAPSGTERTLWKREVPPQYPLERLFDEIPDAIRKVIGGRFLVLAVTPNTVNQTVFATLGVAT